MLSLLLLSETLSVSDVYLLSCTASLILLLLLKLPLLSILSLLCGINIIAAAIAAIATTAADIPVIISFFPDFLLFTELLFSFKLLFFSEFSSFPKALFLSKLPFSSDCFCSKISLSTGIPHPPQNLAPSSSFIPQFLQYITFSISFVFLFYLSCQRLNLFLYKSSCRLCQLINTTYSCKFFSIYLFCAIGRRIISHKNG